MKGTAVSIALTALVIVTGCLRDGSSGSTDRPEASLRAAHFSADSAILDNPYVALTPGTRRIFEEETLEGGTEIVEIFGELRDFTEHGRGCGCVRDPR